MTGRGGWMKAMIRSELSIVGLPALSVEWLVGRLRGWLELARYLTVHQPDQPDPLPGQHSSFFVEEETCTKFYKCTEPPSPPYSASTTLAEESLVEGIYNEIIPVTK